MKSVLSDWDVDAPLVIGHRGASRYAPENTLAAFRLAAEMGADAIELDVQLTVDGQIVVLHDRTLDRTTNGTGLVSTRNWAELKHLDAGSHFDQNFAEEKIPLLAKVLSEFGEQLLINIEIKNLDRPFSRLPGRVVQLVADLNLQHRVLLSSFNPIALRKARALSKEIPLGLLIASEEPEWVRGFFRWISPHNALHPPDKLITTPLINEVHQQDRYIIAWTLNDEDRMRTLINDGIDGIITDVPDIAKQVITSSV
jgi:glycerophosphoryl diester phosphodiesterase